MKKIFQFIGLFTLICFSFFYTEKVVTVLNEQDPIMVEIENKKGMTEKSCLEIFTIKYLCIIYRHG